MINASKIKVANVSRYFCVDNASIAKLRDKVLNNDQDDGLESQDGNITCGYHGYHYDGEGDHIFFKSTSYQTKLYGPWYFFTSLNCFISIRDIENGSVISLPRILQKFDSRVFFKETIAYDTHFYTHRFWLGHTYEQEILLSKKVHSQVYSSKRYVKMIWLSNFTDGSKPNLNLSKALNSTQDENLVIVPIPDHLDPNWIIVFFAPLGDKQINYATVKQHICPQEVFISADDNNTAPIHNKSQISAVISKMKSVVNFYCANYSTYFRVLGNDTCPKNPENTLNISHVHGNSKMTITTFHSTWRTYVCYKIDLGNFKDFRFLC